MQNWSTIDDKNPLWKKLKRGEITDVIFDSGGYQLQTGTKSKRMVELRFYSNWLRWTLRDYPNIKYLNLDIRGRPDLTLENLAYLESCGLNPIPIWHFSGSDVYDVYLDYYCDRYDHIAIGDIAKGYRGSTYRLCEYLMQKYPKTNFHLLGIGNALTVVCKIYRPYSADASTWLAPARWGTEILFNGKDLISRQMSQEDREAVRNNSIRTYWTGKAIQAIKDFERTVNSTEPKAPHQIHMFVGDEPIGNE